MTFLELSQIENLAKSAASVAKVEVVDHVELRGARLPVYAFRFGPDRPDLPCFGLFAGVHGLENVGTHVAIHYLTSLVHQLSWDEDLKHRLTKCRLVAIPMINPGGMYLKRRSNPDGIDLMRNAPQDAAEPPLFLVGGHRFTHWLPWYRGQKDARLAKENQILSDFVKREMFPAPVCLSLDIHSGFGMIDRLWYPYGKTREPFPDKRKAKSLHGLLDRSYPHHVYKVESQSDAYLIHGDMWDYLYDLHREHSSGLYIPWALEMGSWLWIRKNPLQAFSLNGPFNPIKPHRYRRIMRRHMHLIDFLFRAVIHSQAWRS